MSQKNSKLTCAMREARIRISTLTCAPLCPVVCPVGKTMAQVAAAQLVALGLREPAVPLGGDVAGLDQSSPDDDSSA